MRIYDEFFIDNVYIIFLINAFIENTARKEYLRLKNKIENIEA